MNLGSRAVPDLNRADVPLVRDLMRRKLVQVSGSRFWLHHTLHVYSLSEGVLDSSGKGEQSY